jgi:hypothetical protein
MILLRRVGPVVLGGGRSVGGAESLLRGCRTKYERDGYIDFLFLGLEVLVMGTWNV